MQIEEEKASSTMEEDEERENMNRNIIRNGSIGTPVFRSLGITVFRILGK